LRQRSDDLVVLREATLPLLGEDQPPLGENVELALLAGDDLRIV